MSNGWVVLEYMQVGDCESDESIHEASRGDLLE